MQESLRSTEGKKQRLRLLCQAGLVLSPFLLLLLIWLFTGKNGFAAWPIWSDELDYWRSLYNWNAVGFRTGYSGMHEAAPQLGALSVHGFTPILLYGWFVKLFGLQASTIVLCNALTLSLGALVFCVLVRPKPAVSLGVTLLTMTYVPVVLYAFTSMTELFNYSMLLVYAALLWNNHEKPKPFKLALAVACVAVLCLYRVNYFPLIFPLAWVFGGKRLSLKTWLAALAGAALTFGCYALSSAYTAPYVQGFLYNFLHVGDVSAAWRMLLSHAKSNLGYYLAFYKVDIIQLLFRRLYMLVLLFTLLGAFLRVEKKEKSFRVRFGFDGLFLACFLWLALSLGIVVTLYEVADWADFRTLAPVLWLVPVCLLVNGRKAVPCAALLCSLALFAVLCCHEPLGAYADPGRFSPPPVNEKLTEALEQIPYDREAADPFANTVRTDLSGVRQLNDLAPGLGVQYGWFTPETIGRSRWLLTDALKTPIEGYEQVYTAHGVSLYRLLDAKEEP